MELEAVIGHELTHVRSRDILVLTLVSVFSTVAWYLSLNLFFFGGIQGRNRDSAGDDGNRNIGCNSNMDCKFSNH